MTDSADRVSEDEVERWFEEDSPSSGGVEQDADKDDPAEKYARSQLRVVRETKDYQLDYLRHALEPGRESIDISPAYQRRLRWPNKKKSLLIESFLLNIPVPPIYLYERDYNSYEVIDGRQRLDAISSFMANDFALSGLEYWPELNRKRFRDLPTVLKNGLLRRSLPAVVLLAETQRSDEDGLDVRRVLFDRLNTGGIKLNPQELRNALYPGSLNDLLIRLSRSDAFSATWGIPSRTPNEDREPPQELLDNPLYASLADAELVLRVFALRDAIATGKRGSLRRILDSYMSANSDVSEERAGDYERSFLDCLGRLIVVFGDDTFRLPTTSRLSRPLYDALMIALMLDEMEDIEYRAASIREALALAFAEPDEYEILVGRGNTIDAIKDRVELASHILNSGRKLDD
ncbi:hypothetical protein GCM10023094_24670 [Rhodococcus olei]|uniref:GmrSD restriction endonucleases N-terminal domain-containing protein n=1 Tax=Rhodococcus olei TaxID=2161675 RepID=A0ABP8P0N6_9NOCA